MVLDLWLQWHDECGVTVLHGGPENEPFRYNSALHAGQIEGQTRKYSQSYQRQDYKAGGVWLRDVFMGTEPTSQAAEHFASNKPKNFSLKWAESVHSKNKIVVLANNLVTVVA